MLNAPEPACLVIADISGYTSYLAGVELDHAQDILADLMDTVVGSLRPSFRLAKLEGDAAFAYAVTATIDGSALMDTVERTYFAFRRRLRDIGQASTCDCNACMRMPTLDLKVLAHHGTIVRQRMAGREELVGSDVILAHRLLKNEVTERTGATAYALYTDACLRAASVDPATLGLIEHRETYDHIGAVTGWVADLGAAWTAELERTRVAIEPGAAIATVDYDLPAPPAIAWDYLTSPARRPRWQAGVSEVIEQTAGGRRGVGTTNHCVHGKDAIVEEILDWRPPEYFTMRWQMPIPGAPKVRAMYTLDATDAGTHVTMRMERPRSKKERAFLEQLLPMLGPMFEAGIAALRPLLEAEMIRRAEEAAANPEPDVPASGGRFLAPAVDLATARSS
ncbi:MAG: DUF2652 domain-containing protein [Chloroflexi bacterium]|nr:DUF2652 domain-containing protein [Chloroflexota bacterium]